MCVIPISRELANLIEMQDSHEHFTLQSQDLPSLTIHRVQIREEIRKKSPLTKKHRMLEITFPVPKSAKRKKLEDLFLQNMKKQMLSMSNEELEEAIESFSSQSTNQKIYKTYH